MPPSGVYSSEIDIREESTVYADSNSCIYGRVLIIGINYAPEPTGIAPYTTAMAEHLAAAGAQVEVLTGVPHYPSWRVPTGHRTLRRTSSQGPVRLTRFRHYVPQRQTAARRALYEATFMANLLAADAVRPHAADVVLAVTPSLGGALAAARIARRLDAPLYVLVQDLLAKATTQSGIPGGRSVAGMTAALEGRALRAATRVGVVSDAFVPAVESYGVAGDRIDLIPNWTHITPSRLDRCAARAELGWSPHDALVIHTGNMGLKQDLDNVLAAARRLQSCSGLRFVLVGDGSQRAHLMEQAADLPNVEFVAPLDDDRYPVALAAADLLLVNERPSVGDMALPSKITSYLGAGRPVLAAVDPHGATAKELARTAGAAHLVEPGDPDQLADGVRALIADPARCAEMARAGGRYAATRLTRSHALAQLDAGLAQMLGIPASTGHVDARTLDEVTFAAHETRAMPPLAGAAASVSKPRRPAEGRLR